MIYPKTFLLVKAPLGTPPTSAFVCFQLLRAHQLLRCPRGHDFFGMGAVSWLPKTFLQGFTLGFRVQGAGFRV